MTLTFVAGTWNLWGSERWPERADSVRAFLSRHRPDILALQELTPEIREVLDQILDGHERIHNGLSGWSTEGNIYWNRSLFRRSAFGAEDIGLTDDRRLFWARLEGAAGPERLLVATAHLTWPGTDEERASGENARVVEARALVRALERLREPGEGLLVLADLNDPTHPHWILEDEGGLREVHDALGRKPTPTFPATIADQGSPQVLDWIHFDGPLAPMCCDTVDFLHERVAPSDHRPVLTTLRWLSSRTAGP